MAASMTGMGSAEIRHGGSTIVAEIKSVNNRFLEVSCRITPLLSMYEKDIRELIRGGVRRGKVFVTVTIQGESGETLGLKVDDRTVQAIRSLLNDLRKRAGIREQLKLDHFLKFSEVFEARGGNRELEQLWLGVRKSLVSALEKLKTMRLQEGRALSRDIHQRIQSLNGHVHTIEKLSKSSIQETHKRTVERVRQIARDVQLDKDRLYTELALLADKLDVTEECVRLRSHHELFARALKEEDEVGKKLTFLLQEMNREVNTISAKSNHLEIGHLVVRMKEEIEKLREQVQNLE
jgi:uncharacterized protein (TIGR00255 family)